ncbi:MAG: Curli biosis system outer rane secretion channel CsgG [Mucilaginibacter sp.]|nr:Curli biosis system outer rane secretion channel CsgG [Mucilaginibacter sp.]
MENHIYSGKRQKAVKLFAKFILFGCLLFGNNAFARLHIYKVYGYVAEREVIDTEKKVDYIEKIYFSDKNKADLNTMIVTTIQNIQETPPTPAVVKQYVFLTGIRDRANSAENACEIEEILAAGIYGIDANEAVLKNIPKPSDKANATAGDALAKVNNLKSSAQNLILSASTIKGGTYGSYAALNKYTNTASTVGGTVNTIASGKKLVDDFNKFFPKKDKPCKSIQQKEIQIGTHLLPDSSTMSRLAARAAGTKITFKNIKYNQLNIIASSIEKIPGVNSVNSDDFSNNTSTMIITHNMKVKELINNILKSNNTINLNVESIAANAAILSIK